MGKLRLKETEGEKFLEKSGNKQEKMCPGVLD